VQYIKKKNTCKRDRTTGLLSRVNFLDRLLSLLLLLLLLLLCVMNKRRKYHIVTTILKLVNQRQNLSKITETIIGLHFV
jgi:hypothetical protein